MDWWLILKFGWGGLSFLAMAAILVVAWRARGIVSWNRSIRRELKALEQDAQMASTDRKAAIDVILARCFAIYHSPAPRFGGVDELRDYVSQVAACFFPEAKRPELQVSLGQIMNSIQISLIRFNNILTRPGLARIQSLNIRTIRKLYGWSEEMLHHPFAKWYLAHSRQLRYLTPIRLVIMPDPFSWLFFLSQRLVTLVLLKHLLVDVYLFTGKLALAAYGDEQSPPESEDRQVLEATLEELYGMPEREETLLEPQITAIRKNLVGFPALLLSDPTWEQWRAAIQEAAELIARKHFPESDTPLEEAALGPLLYRTHAWLSTLAQGQKISVVRHIYKTRLITLFQAKDITDLMLPPIIRKVIRKTFQAYGWLKWPLKAYRFSRKTTLPAIAVNIGWTLSKKSALALIYGRSFDQVCSELDMVYQLSRKPQESGRGDGIQDGQEMEDTIVSNPPQG